MFHLSPTSAFHTGYYPPAPQAEYVYSTPLDHHFPGRGVDLSCRHVHSYPRHSGYAASVPYYPPIAFDMDAALEEYAIAQRREQLIQQEKLRRIRAAEEYHRRLEDQRRAKVIAELVMAVQQEAIIKKQSRRAQVYEAYERAKLEEVARSQLAMRAQREAEWKKCAEAKQAFLDALRSRDIERAQQSGPCVKSRTTAGPKVATPQEALRRRLSEDDDVDMQEVIANVLKLMSVGPLAAPDAAQKKPAEPAAKSDKGKARESPNIVFPWEMFEDLQLKQDKSGETTRKVHFDKPISTPAVPVKKPEPPTQVPVKAEGTETQPEPAISQEKATELSLGAINRIGDLLQQLQGSFVFPSELDHPSRSSTPSPVSDSDSAQLPFTSKNKPVHLYEHSLNGLLARLDEVDSHGDEEVRRRRKEVVLAVEKALEDIDRKVTEVSPVIEKQTLPEEVEDSSLPAEVAVAEATVVAQEAVVAEKEVATQEEVIPELEVAKETPIVEAASVVSEPQTPIHEDVKVEQPSQATVVIEESLEAVPVIAEPEVSQPAFEIIVPPSSPVLEDVEVEEVSAHEVSPVIEVASESEMPAPSAEPDVPAVSVEEDSLVVEEIQVLDTFTPTPNVEVEAVEAPADSHSVLPIPSATFETTEAVPTTGSSEKVEPPTTTAEFTSAPSDAETSFLLQSHQEDDQSYVRAKARVAESKDEGENGWEAADLSGSDIDVDGETWSEVE